MTKSIRRVSICFVLAIALAFTMMPMAAQPAKAAEGVPAGAVTMPASKTFDMKTVKEAKINFGDTSFDSYYYFEVKPMKTGTITLSGSADYPVSGYVALCNASKKVLSKDSKTNDGTWFWTGSSTNYLRTVHFGVKKGKTYYIRIAKCRVTSYAKDANNQYVHIGYLKWTNTAVKSAKYGKKKSKAVKIKKKKTKTGLFVAGTTKAQWYKMKINKKKATITLTSTKNCGAIKAKVYYKGYSKWLTTTTSASRSGSYYKVKLTGINRNVGTVYVKVFPEYKTSGSYKLKWK